MTAGLPPIRVSVALVTRNRPESLSRCLQSLRAQSAQPFEVVISDDSDPGMAGATEDLARQWACRYMPGPRRGLYANRNQAALACRGSHLRTMDDDHRFPPGHFERCIAATESDPRAIWTTGEIGYIDGKYYARSDTANQLHPSGVGGPVADRDDNWAIADGSTIYPRCIFDRGHRMIEDFPFGSAYLEFGAFLYHHGYRSRCLPGVLVEHYADRNTLGRNQDIDVLKSRIYASLCFNLYFRRSLLLAVKYVAAYAIFRGPCFALLRAVPGIARRVQCRWHRTSEASVREVRRMACP